MAQVEVRQARAEGIESPDMKRERSNLWSSFLELRPHVGVVALLAMCACSSEPSALREGRMRGEAELEEGIPLGSSEPQIREWAAAKGYDIQKSGPDVLLIELDKVDPGTDRGFCGPVPITAVITLDTAGRSKSQGATWASACGVN